MSKTTETAELRQLRAIKVRLEADLAKSQEIARARKESLNAQVATVKDIQKRLRHIERAIILADTSPSRYDRMLELEPKAAE